MKTAAYAFLAASCLGAACENSVVSTTGTGSGGGAPGGVTISSTSAGMGSATPFNPPVCDAFCNAVGNCFNNCQVACESYLFAPCDSQGTALVQCYTASFDPMTCQSDDCVDAISAFETCRASVPQNCSDVATACGGGKDSCASVAECAGGEERAICDTSGGTAMCTCYLNGLVVGFCKGPQLAGPCETCDVRKTGCCAAGFGT
jgi:hypothetical protein